MVDFLRKWVLITTLECISVRQITSGPVGSFDHTWRKVEKSCSQHVEEEGDRP